MSRTKVFVSYSHTDRGWMDLVRTHLAMLERQELVHIWSDVRIEAGTAWTRQIEAALTEARVAVLLVSPAYLASQFIWDNEIPLIMKHQKVGMRVMPLVTRPCAWLLEPQLSGLQARPADGRPLSIGTEGQIDLDLAAFAYELAGIVGRLPNADAASEWERMTVAVGVSRSGTAVPEAINRSGRPSSPPLLAPVWSGRYRQTDMQLTLRVERQTGADFLGEIEYDHGALTEVAGRIEGGDAGSSAPGLAVVFSETRIVRDGKRPISLDGEYRASISGDRMTGGWFSGGVLKGDFVLVAGDKRQKQLDGDTVKKVPLSRRSPRE